MQKLAAQKYEIGPYFGGSNFIGDVGETTFIKPNSLAFGGIVKWNKSPRHSWRMSLIYTQLKADDARSNQERRVARGYSFSNNLLELNLGLEFNFWEWDIYSRNPGITPYLATGISGMYTNDLFLNSDEELEKKRNKYGLALPMIVGAKSRISQTFILSFEIGARMAFSNNLDGSNPKEFGGEGQHPSFGNPNQNDWYVFTGLILTFSFGQNPCYDTY